MKVIQFGNVAVINYFLLFCSVVNESSQSVMFNRVLSFEY